MVIKHLYIAARSVDKSTQHSRFAQRLAAVHKVFEQCLQLMLEMKRLKLTTGTYHSGVSNWNTRKYNQMFGLSFHDLSVASIPHPITRRLVKNFIIL